MEVEGYKLAGELVVSVQKSTLILDNGRLMMPAVAGAVLALLLFLFSFLFC